MLSVEEFYNEHKDDSYQSLLLCKNMIIKEIKDFEEKKIPEYYNDVSPSPAEVYCMNYRYLKVLADLILLAYEDSLKQ